MQAQGQARSLRSSCCRVANIVSIFAFLAVMLALPVVFICIVIMTTDYLAAALCFIFYLGAAASVSSLWRCMDCGSAPPETTRRRHTIDVSEDDIRANFEQVYPARTVAEERGVEEGVVNAEDLPYAEDEPCIICLERKEATH
mmetsp:Transcript_65812/g.166719  ORF Transcript_65812/g.166719 Transcript_65812/m.166719 type:complete len:143 (-) Transcript_65812:10-438(-)